MRKEVNIITHKEAIAISAYTGFCFAPFDEIHQFIEEVLGRPVFTHELARDDIWDDVRKSMQKNLDEYIHIDD